MKKLSTILGAGALAFTLGGFAFAADEPAPAGDAQQQQYQAALKKCESLPQTEQQKCIDAAKKKFGQM
jgi:hypothetical protein